jgi:hypothetical protein
MVNDGRIRAIEEDHLIESLRESDFDIPSAIGELIDNSIQAESKKIFISVEDINAGGKRKYRLIDKIICGDDGEGMEGSPEGVLHKCIKLGFSTRFNNRDGVGRFGVGMTLAGIRFATKIEVFSKLTRKKWYYVNFNINDSDDITKGIAPPVQKELPNEYAKFVGKDHGTLVIWSGYDKHAEHDLHSITYDDNYHDESLNPYGRLNHWLGRTFRKSIWDGVELYLNNKQVYSFDPLYLNKTKNQFEKDKPADVMWKGKLEWPIPPKLRKNADVEEKSTINITITLLPEVYRTKKGMGAEHFNKGRYIFENEGISVLRHNREVFYDHIPHFGPPEEKKLKFEDPDRWWGCEIAFEPELDEYFTVKNIKRGALPVKALKEALYEKIYPVREDCRAIVSKDWAKYENSDGKPLKPNELPNPHKIIEKIVDDVKLPQKPKAGMDLTEDEKKKTLTELLQGLNEVEEAQWRARFEAQPFTIKDEFWRGDTFLYMTYFNGKAILQINNSNIFFEEFRSIRAELQECKDPIKTIELAKRIQHMMEILLMALVRARQIYPDDETYQVKVIWDSIMQNWGTFLATYTQAYKKVEKSEDS